MFESLSERLERSFKVLRGQGKITEINVAETTKEIRKALIDADVSYAIAKEFTNSVKEKAIGMNVINAVSPNQLMVKITYDELIALMGSQAEDINLKGSPAVILMAGLQGSGKTTHSAKLANLLKTKRGKKPLLVACDVYRPAAIDQLQVLGKQIEVEVYAEPDNKKPVEIAKNAVKHAKDYGYDVVIVDTAGRLAVDKEMMDEIGNIKDAVNTAKAFNEKLNFDGVILTKLDGDTRGGAALTVRKVTGKPIKFIGTGEKMEALDVFHPERMAERILGMGDIRSFVERAQEQFDDEEAAKLSKKLAKNQFDFNDFNQQIQQIKKMGNVKDLMGMIPGMGKIVRNMDIDDNVFKSVEVMIQSMTPEERANPDIINGSRRKRIARGSGRDIQDVNRLIKQFDDIRKVMKAVNNGSGKTRGMMKAMKARGRR